MDPSFVGMAAVIALLTITYLFKSDDKEKAREAAAARLGLFFHPKTFGSESRLEGKLGELAVVVRFVAGGRGESRCAGCFRRRQRSSGTSGSSARSPPGR